VTTTADPEARRPGRPRSTEANEAILEAAVDLFAEGGYDGLTVEGVAARANVGKATIYRRYPSKVDLVIAASRCFALDDDDLAPDSGDTRADLRALVDWLIAMVTTTPIGRALPMMVADRARIPELAEAHRALVAEKRARHRVVLQRGIDRGDLRADADLEVVIDSYVGPIFYRFLISDAPLDAPFADTLVDSVLRAYGT
jgi:AcrR family transcriptional regulator